MRFTLHGLGIVSLLFHIICVSATTSYVSLRNEDVVDTRVSSAADIIDAATVKQPLVVFQFSKFKLLEALMESDEIFPFLNKYFKDSITNVLTDDVKLSTPKKNGNHLLFKFKDLPEKASDLLYHADVENKNVVWLTLKSNNYDLYELDQFLETIVIYLEEYLNVNIDIVVNSEDTLTIEDFDKSMDEDISYNNEEEQDKDTHGEPEDDDDDSLSPIWTEGLLMCLLVSFILLIILIIALSWIASLDITYGALEKSTNPLKKNQ